jgi:hypothetical protein
VVFFLGIYSSVGLVPSFWDIIRISIMRISHYIDTSRVWLVDGIFGLGIRGTQVKSSIQDIMDEVAPIKKNPLWG